MTHQISLLSWRIEKLGNFGCTQSLVSRHSSLLTYGPRRSVKLGQGVDTGIARTSNATASWRCCLSVPLSCIRPPLFTPRGQLIIATMGPARLLQSTIGTPSKQSNVRGSSQNAYQTGSSVSSGQPAGQWCAAPGLSDMAE